VVSVITEDFDVAVVEKGSGYLQTAWKEYKGAKVRVTCKVESRAPFKLKLKVEQRVTKTDVLSGKSSEVEGAHPGIESEIMERLKGRISQAGQ
jgi:hypothetical protein